MTTATIEQDRMIASPVEIVERLDPASIRAELERLEGQKEALRILLRAALARVRQRASIEN